MLSHVMLGSTDMDRSTAFYDAVLAPLGAKHVMQFGSTIVWGTDKPSVAVGYPHDGKKATNGNGTMVALVAPGRDIVDAVHALALQYGGTDEGAPGPRGNQGFYAGYFRDPDQNKLCIYHWASPG
jgi:catechol 2,3-dioxygenase-like lactoylglutathione lyase family enzyme